MLKAGGSKRARPWPQPSLEPDDQQQGWTLLKLSALLKINQKCSTVTCLQKSGEIIYKFAKFLMFILSGFSSPFSSAKGRTSNPDRRRRWSSLAKPALGVALAMGVLTAGQAQAFVVNVGGQDYDVTTFTGSYYANTSKFATPANGGVMPWWGDEVLVNEFAIKVGFMGYPTGEPFNGVQSAGPLFAFFESGWVYYGYYWKVDPFLPHHFYTALGWPERVVTYAQVAPANSLAASVPGPLPALGAAAAFGFSRKLRKRTKGSANALSSSYSL